MFFKEGSIDGKNDVAITSGTFRRLAIFTTLSLPACQGEADYPGTSDIYTATTQGENSSTVSETTGEDNSSTGMGGNSTLPDTTPPPTPVIENTEEEKLTIFFPSFPLHGSCYGKDTEWMWYSKDKDDWQLIEDYVPGDNDWLVTIPMEADKLLHLYCVLAMDESENISIPDCLYVNRYD